MTTRTAGTLEIVRTIKADPETVFAAWTEPEHLEKWSCPEGLEVSISEVGLSIGGRFTLQMRSPDGETHTARGVYREIERPCRLVYTWAWDEHPEDGESLITVEFAAVNEGTQVTMVHSGLPTEESVRNHEGGWTSCLDRLEALYTN
jgi:uncharacterized protein YndB with AHSA1/START domain